MAAEALARFGPPASRARAIDVLLENSNAATQPEYVAVFALYALGQVTDLPDAVKQAVKALPRAATTAPGGIPQRETPLPKLIEAIVAGVR